MAVTGERSWQRGNPTGVASSLSKLKHEVAGMRTPSSESELQNAVPAITESGLTLAFMKAIPVPSSTR